MNTLIVIGWLGARKAYLNLSEEEALKRYCAAEGCTEAEAKEAGFFKFEFEDEFNVYDAYAN